LTVYVYVLGILSTAILIIYLLVKFKLNSSIGRLCIWQVVIIHLKEHFWFGIGLGRFSIEYPNWQSDFFKDFLNLPHSFYYTASETYLAFNEPLQLLCEIGFVGFVFFLIIIVRTLLYKPNKYSANFIFYSKVSIILILICSVTSFILHSTVILLLLTIQIAGIHLDKKKDAGKEKKFYPNSVVNKFFILTSTSVLVITNFNFPAEVKSTFKYHELLQNPTTIAEDRNKYEDIYQTFNTNGKFLYSYGTFLFTNLHNYELGIKTLEKVK